MERVRVVIQLQKKITTFSTNVRLGQNTFINLGFFDKGSPFVSSFP